MSEAAKSPPPLPLLGIDSAHCKRERAGGAEVQFNFARQLIEAFEVTLSRSHDGVVLVREGVFDVEVAWFTFRACLSLARETERTAQKQSDQRGYDESA